MIEKMVVCDCSGCSSQALMSDDFYMPEGWRVLHVYIPLTKSEIEFSDKHPDVELRKNTFDLAVCPKHGHVKLGFTVSGCELMED